MMSVAVDIKASNSIYALANRNTANIDDRTTIRRNPNWRLQFATLRDILCLDDFLKTPIALLPTKLMRITVFFATPSLFFFSLRREERN